MTVFLAVDMIFKASTFDVPAGSTRVRSAKRLEVEPISVDMDSTSGNNVL